MKKLLRKTLLVLILALFLVSCGTVETIPPSPTEESRSISSVLPYSTALPTISFTSTPLITAVPTTSAQATIAAFSRLCSGAKEISRSEVSPDGKWIAALCYDEYGKEESPLQIVSIDHSKEWKIYYNAYAKNGLLGDRHDGMIPYRWSEDGKFIYAAAFSRLSGCCWIGGKYVLLVRLNLETGEQAAIINGTDFGSDPAFSFTISEDDRYLIFTPITDQTYDIEVLDLLSNEKRTVMLNDQKLVDLEYARLSPNGNLIVLPLYKHLEFRDFLVEEIALIDLTLNRQRTLITGLGEKGELYPIRWLDEEHVLMSSLNPSFLIEKESAEYWSLNIITGEQQKSETP